MARTNQPNRPYPVIGRVQVLAEQVYNLQAGIAMRPQETQHVLAAHEGVF